jgi:predicted transposase YdaD
MPILNDIMDHEVIGPLLRQGMEIGRIDGRIEGRVEGRVEGRIEGLIEGERRIILLQLSHRFGTVPAWAKNRIERMSAAEVAGVAARLLNASGLEDLLR